MNSFGDLVLIALIGFAICDVDNISGTKASCQEHREFELKRNAIGNFIPTCQTDGTYAPKQCWGSTGMCWCADANGNEITEASRGYLNCG